MVSWEKHNRKNYGRKNQVGKNKVFGKNTVGKNKVFGKKHGRKNTVGKNTVAKKQNPVAKSEG